MEMTLICIYHHTKEALFKQLAQSFLKEFHQNENTTFKKVELIDPLEYADPGPTDHGREMPYYSCWVSETNSRVGASEANHSGAECVLSNPLLLGEVHERGRRSMPRDRLPCGSERALRQGWHVSCHPCRSRPRCLLVSQHLGSHGERGRQEQV